MSSNAAPRCRHIKINGTQCGSPALRDKSFCFYHQQNRPMSAECYYKADEYSTGEITLPYFEDAHSIQTVIRQIVQMVLQKRLARETASTLLYTLQIASSNLKRMELEKPQPEQVLTDVEQESEWKTPIAVRDQTSESLASGGSANAQPADHDLEASPASASIQTNDDRVADKDRVEYKNGVQEKDRANDRSGEDLPPGTIHACYEPAPQMRSRTRQNLQRKQQYVI
jgi:hypothetical protein